MTMSDVNKGSWNIVDVSDFVDILISLSIYSRKGVNSADV